MENAKWYAAVRILVGLALVFFGVLKLVNPGMQAEYFAIFPAFVRPLVGLLEMIGGAALAIGWRQRWAALGLAVIMLGAVTSHLIVGISGKMVPSVVLLSLTLLLATRPARTLAR